MQIIHSRIHLGDDAMDRRVPRGESRVMGPHPRQFILNTNPDALRAVIALVVAFVNVRLKNRPILRWVGSLRF